MYNINGSYKKNINLNEAFLVETTIQNKLSNNEVIKMKNQLETIWGKDRVQVNKVSNINDLDNSQNNLISKNEKGLLNVENKLEEEVANLNLNINAINKNLDQSIKKINRNNDQNMNKVSRNLYQNYVNNPAMAENINKINRNLEQNYVTTPAMEDNLNYEINKLSNEIIRTQNQIVDLANSITESTEESISTNKLILNNKGAMEIIGDTLKIELINNNGNNIVHEIPYFSDIKSLLDEKVDITANGDVGIDVNDPKSKLDVNGEIRVRSMDGHNTEGTAIKFSRKDNPDIRFHQIRTKNKSTAANNYVAFDVHNGSSVTGLTEVMKLRGDGKVGIGSNPQYKLDLANNDDSIIRAREFKPWGDQFSLTTGASRLALKSSASQGIGFYTGEGLSSNDTTEKMRIKEDGKVGIGTVNPTEKLSVNGNTRVRGSIQSLNGGSKNGSTDDNIALVANAHSTGKSSAKVVLRRDNGNFYGSEVLGGLPNSDSTSPNELQDNERFAINVVNDGNKTRSLSIENNGNVGIGTTAPTEKLEVNGNTKINGGAEIKGGIKCIGGYSGIVLERNSATFNDDNTNRRWSINMNRGHPNLDNLNFKYNDGDSIVSLKNDGKVGIGTESPTYPLSVKPSLNNNAEFGHTLIGYAGTNNVAGVQHNNLPINGKNMMIKQNTSGETAVNASNGQNIYFNIDNSPKAVIKSNGNFGIGTNNPTEKLHVDGNVKINNNLDIGGNLKVLPQNTQNVNFSGNNPINTEQYATKYGSDYNKNNMNNVQLTGGDNGSQSIIFTAGGSYQNQLRNIQGYDTLTARNNERPISINGLGGNVGIGKLNPSYSLDVNGKTKLLNNVGIGTNPENAFKLKVNGNTKINGNITMGGADFNIWNSTKGGNNTSDGRALVHLGDGNKDSSKLVLNYNNDFGSGVDIGTGPHPSNLKVHGNIETGRIETGSSGIKIGNWTIKENTQTGNLEVKKDGEQEWKEFAFTNDYYTKSDSDNKYAPTSHNHNSSYYTKTQYDNKYAEINSKFGEIDSYHKEMILNKDDLLVGLIMPQVTGNYDINDYVSSGVRYISYKFKGNGTIKLNEDYGVDILLIGGGGGGGGCYTEGGRNSGAGGGGGGGFKTSYVNFQKDVNYVITIGNGGNGGGHSSNGSDGEPTYIKKGSDIYNNLQIGGGGGGGRMCSANASFGHANNAPTSYGGGGSGGGGGGGPTWDLRSRGGTGNNGGGNGNKGESNYIGGGGGGAAGGGNINNTSKDANSGKNNDYWDGSNIEYAGGGGGGGGEADPGEVNGGIGRGGGGIGYNAIRYTGPGIGSDNTGGGGGGAGRPPTTDIRDRSWQNGANGGSGVCIVRLRLGYASNPSIVLVN